TAALPPAAAAGADRMPPDTGIALGQTGARRVRARRRDLPQGPAPAPAASTQPRTTADRQRRGWLLIPSEVDLGTGAISTRRFSARPAASAFDATGCSR